ncbi:MAG TPA: helicase HerA-like domain-containing protein [Thermoplasmata archaeon]|nr:helicase HerA-like domain-containing protein [Thermoplasmata archaeon]
MPLQLGTDPETKAAVELPEAALLRHVVILGATGAGKTVLAKAFLEEAVRAGVPILAVDPQGDLASLALAHTEASAREHPIAPEIAQEYWARAAVSILTPGSTRGIPVGLNPLKSAPVAATSEDLVVALDALAESLAAAMGYDPAGETGGRAKDALFLTLQVALKAGRWPRDIPTLVRILEKEAPPDAGRLLTKREWASLIRRAQSMTVGAKGLLFTAGPALDVESLIRHEPEGRVPVNVVYTGGLRNARERELVVATLCKDIYAWMTAKPVGDLRLVVYIDEVAGLCPPHPHNPPAKKFLSLLFRQARKYGVGIIVATQNVTDLDYKALGQANTWALGRLMAKQDLDRVRHVIASVNGPPEPILAAIPSLHAGEFILLSPDHLASAQRLSVRGLATRHEVVPEEKFREILGTRAVSAPDPAAEDRAARRRRMAAAAARDAKATLPAAVEEGIGLRVLKVFEDAPGLYGEPEIATRAVVDARFLPILLRKLVEHRLLSMERLDGRDVYWDPTVGFDPRRGAPARIAMFPLRYPLVRATKLVRDHVRRRRLGSKDQVARKAFYYLPLWRIEAEVPLGRKGGRTTRQYYVNAATGELGHAVYGRISFEEIPPKDAVKLESLAAKTQLERLPAARIDDPILVAQIGPSRAQEIVRITLGVKAVGAEPELVLLPIWRFDVDSNDDGRIRSVWVDGSFGSVFRKAP